MASKESTMAMSEGEEHPHTSKKQRYGLLETRLAKTELAVGDMSDALRELEEDVEGLDTRVIAIEEAQGSLESSVESAKGELQGLLNKVLDTLRSEIAEVRNSLTARMEELSKATEALKGDVALCKAALASGAMVREGPKLKVPEPPKYGGKRDSKVLDNFLWSIERYFEAMHVTEDAYKISTATMYLEEDAVLWWRRREDDMKKGIFKVGTWDEFKVDMKRQFYPENVEELAMKKLRALRQTGTIKDYIREYSSLMLEIPDMEERSRLIFFIDGLQRWAEQELKRRNVKTLAEAIAAAESLVEFQRDRSSKKGKDAKDSDSEKEESEDESPTPRARIHRRGKPHPTSGSRDKGKPISCFLCEGPHLARHCPQRQKLNALVASLGEEPEEPRRIGALRLEEEPKLANMKLLNATRVEEPREDASETKGQVIEQRDRLIIKGEVNDGDTELLVDTGATHNFLALEEAKNLGVKFTKVEGEFKTATTGSMPILGKAWKVPIRLGKWKGKIDFLVVNMEEPVVLGMEFLNKVSPFHVYNGVINITSKGVEYGIKLEASKDVGIAKISSLRAKWRRQVQVLGRTRKKTQQGQGSQHKRQLLTRSSRNQVGEIVTVGPYHNRDILEIRGSKARDGTKGTCRANSPT